MLTYHAHAARTRTCTHSCLCPSPTWALRPSSPSLSIKPGLDVKLQDFWNVYDAWNVYVSYGVGEPMPTVNETIYNEVGGGGPGYHTYYTCITRAYTYYTYVTRAHTYYTYITRAHTYQR